MIKMVKEHQAKIACDFTGSSLSPELINQQIKKTPKKVKMNLCLDIDAVINEYALPYDIAYPIVKKSMETIAKRTKIDPATLFCIYMAWKSDK
jgi:hypothetical protein